MKYDYDSAIGLFGNAGSNLRSLRTSRMPSSVPIEPMIRPIRRSWSSTVPPVSPR